MSGLLSAFNVKSYRSSYSINSADTSISRSKQLEAAIPPSQIAALSSGEFVGMVADNPDQKIELKSFHCEILNDHEALKREQEGYKEIPIVKKLDSAIIQRSYLQIRQDVQDIVQSEMEMLLNDPSARHLVIRK
ncbi:hypothetical protein [Flavisolibacter ginsenosidimutans]|uniref:hypothetical protein n=1 Tax=Flavisolibacter ginsenosidimutans TaxID=661481 RepID=UPI001D15DC60|nr:hypothetical protein [Flavisolibacter ginsenosidimutans]